MDRFVYDSVGLFNGEDQLVRLHNTKLYDGDTKTSFEGGVAILTHYRLIWARSEDLSQNGTCISLPLFYAMLAEEESPSAFSFSSSSKVVIHVTPVTEATRKPGPCQVSLNSYIKISVKNNVDGIRNLLQCIREALAVRRWLTQPLQTSPPKNQPPAIKPRVGIIGIERGIHEKQKETNQNISEAFQDLSKLMGMAKEMVNLARNVSSKIRERQGNITEDETIQFKSYLLSLGIDDPVTRDSSSSESQYIENLARQLVSILENPIKDQGGMMSMAEAYCRVNRARGLELLSAEDLLRACCQLEKLGLPIQLRKFDSGTMVLQLITHSDEIIIQRINQMYDVHEWLTAEIVAQEVGISVLLAKEHLITSEKFGASCRDESIEGLKFYSNLFLKN